MREDLDKLICEKYPLIFQNRHENMQKTLMCFGFCHGDGWCNIIDNLCDGIQKHCDSKKAAGDPGFQVVAVQVKEKYGGLRFYINGGDDHIYDLIRVAEKASYETCEECGDPGKLNQDGWWTTTCEPCMQKRNERRANR